jgi:alpha-mannosidase
VVNVSSHCDWSWGHTRAWHEERYAETIRQVLLLMRDNPHYIWQLENENEQLRPFLAKAAREWPGMAEEFWQRVRQRRIEVIVAITNPRLTEIYPETTVRNLVLAHEYFARHVPGYRQEVYNSVDLMCGSSQMPQILSKAGFRYFMFSRPVGQQAVFWRKGLDGTRMLSAREFYGYKASGKPGQTVFGLAPVPVWRHAIGGDDVLPDPKLPAEAETWDPQKKILATVARWFEEVEKYGPRIGELSGVLDSLECYVEAGIHGQRSLYMANNQDEDLLLALETAQVMAGPQTAVKPQTNDDLWHDVLSCAGHAIQWAWATDYDERLDFVRSRREKIQRALVEAQRAVAGQIAYRTDLGDPIVVFNSHGWTTSGPAAFALAAQAPAPLLRDSQGRVVPLQCTGKIAPDRWSYVLMADDVPGCGFKTYYLSVTGGHPLACQQAVQPPKPVENEFYRASVRPDGRLEITDKATGRALGDPQQGGLGDVVFYDAPPPQHWMMNGPLGPRHGWQVGQHETSSFAGAACSSLSATGKIGPHTITREVRLFRGLRRLDFHVEIQAAEGNGAFFVRFPLGLSGHVTGGIPFGAEPREDFDREIFRGEYFVKGYPDGFSATRWADVSSTDRGYTLVCPWGAHTGYAWRGAEKSLEFMLLRVRPLPKGTWGQMSPSLKGTGHHTFDCSLVPHPGTWREAASYRQALEAHLPLIPLVGCVKRTNNASHGSGELHAPYEDQASFAEVTAPGVVLSALRPIGAGRQIELRLYETLGRRTDAVVRLRQPPAKVEETDLLGRPMHELEKLETRGSEIHLRMAPWKILTLRIGL